MKKILTFLTLMLLTLTTLFAQSNDKISYQAVIRNSANQLVVNSEVNVTISVANSQGGSAVYTETHTVTTNENGLMSLLVGEGTLVSGSWSDIDWSSAYVTSTMTVDGETLTHTVPVNAVPYALYADQVDPEQVSNIVTEILPNALENYVTNDQLENYVTDDDLQEAIDGIEFPQADWDAEQGPGVILHKPTIPTSVSDLQGADDLVTDEDLSDALEEIQDGLEENYATKSALADTAASIRSAIPAAANAGTVTLWQGTPNNPLGSFNVNTADNVSIEIPAQVQADWNAEQGLGVILNKPTIPTSVSDLEGADDLVTGEELSEALEGIQDGLDEVLEDYATKEELLADSNALAGQITNLGTAIDNRIKADSLEVLGLYTEAMLKMKADSAAFINAIHDTAEVLRSEMPDAQVQADWNETDADSKAFILNKPTIPEAANAGTVTLWQGTPNNPLGSFDVNTAENVSIEIPTADTKITTAKINEFIDSVKMDTAMAVFPHVQGMDNDVKTGLKTWVAQVVKNNPTYAMDVLTYYIENLTQAQVSEIFGAYGDMNAAAKEDLLDSLASIIKNNPDIAYDVLNYYIDHVDVQRALSVLPHINSMDNGVKTGLKTWVAQVAKNNPDYVMDIAKYYVTYLDQAKVDELLGADNDNALVYAFNQLAPNSIVPQMIHDSLANINAITVNDATLTITQGPNNTLGTFTANSAEDVTIDIPVADTKITTAKINEFIDSVNIDTAMAVLPHVQGMDNDVKTGLKIWVAQVVKNNPTYAMDVLTHYIENLTQAQVSEIFGAYGDMNAAAKEDLLDSLASIIKNNPDIAYDVLNYYIDNVDVQRALSVLPHINSMDNGVKTGLKTWVAQVAKNNPEYVMDIAKHYVTYANTNVVDELIAADDDNALNYAFDKLAPNSAVIPQMIHDSLTNIALPNVNNATLTITQGPNNTLGTFTADAATDVTIDIPVADMKITTAKINEFIDSVKMDTAMAVFPHVQGMDNDVKTGLKIWVAQVVKNNPTYAMDVLTHYIKNLTVEQVGEIAAAYNQMSTAPKDSVLKVLAQIIKDNPDIAYDVLNYYIDNVDVQRALSVLPHINSMDNGVKTGLKTWVAQVAKNNPTYVYDVLDYYLGNTTASTSVGEAITKYAANHKDVAKAIVANYLQNGTAQDVDDMVSALLQNNAGGKEQFKNYLNAYIDNRIPAAATETSQMFTAEAGQTSFTLTNTPKSNYLVRLYVNGLMVGDSSTGVVTVNGTTVTYVPAQNGNYTLKAGDKIIISYFK